MIYPPPKRSDRRGLLVFSLACLVTLSGCGAVGDVLAGMKKPGVSVADVHLLGIGLDGVDLAFDLDVSNPYTVPLPVAGLDYALASGGHRFLNGKTTEQTMIPSGESRVVPLQARVSFIEVMSAVSGLRPGAVVPYTADLGVSVDAPGIGPLRLPVQTQGDFPIPAVPNVSLSSFKWESLSLSKASAVLTLEVGNGNAFPFDLGGLSYSLSLAGTPIVTTSLRDTVSLEPGASGPMEIPFSITPTDLGIAAFRMLSGSGASYSIQGTLDAMTPFGLLNFPFQDAGDTKFSR